MRRTLALVGMLVVVVGAGVAPAQAAVSIERSSFSFGDDGVVDFLPCAFPVNEAFEAHGFEIDRLDADGNLIAASVHLSAGATFTNLDTGYAVEDSDHWTVLVNGRSGSVTVVGLSFHINVPGQGIRVLHAGRLVIDPEGQITFMAGPHDQITSGGYSLCDALS